MKYTLLKTLKRHIKSHNFKYVTNGSEIALCLPFKHGTIQGNKLVKINTLKQLYVAMGY